MLRKTLLIYREQARSISICVRMAGNTDASAAIQIE